MYNYDKLKNTFCGISALGYAAYQGHKEITLVGFDALDPEIIILVMSTKVQSFIRLNIIRMIQ